MILHFDVEMITVIFLGNLRSRDDDGSLRRMSLTSATYAAFACSNNRLDGRWVTRRESVVSNRPSAIVNAMTARSQSLRLRAVYVKKVMHLISKQTSLRQSDSFSVIKNASFGRG